MKTGNLLYGYLTVKPRLARCDAWTCPFRNDLVHLFATMNHNSPYTFSSMLSFVTPPLHAQALLLAMKNIIFPRRAEN